MAGQNPMDQFEAYFRRADLDGDGRISGAEAVSFFEGSNLTKQVLAQVLNFFFFFLLFHHKFSIFIIHLCFLVLICFIIMNLITPSLVDEILVLNLVNALFLMI